MGRWGERKLAVSRLPVPELRSEERNKIASAVNTTAFHEPEPKPAPEMTILEILEHCASVKESGIEELVDKAKDCVLWYQFHKDVSFWLTLSTDPVGGLVRALAKIALLPSLERNALSCQIWKWAVQAVEKVCEVANFRHHQDILGVCMQNYGASLVKNKDYYRGRVILDDAIKLTSSSPDLNDIRPLPAQIMFQYAHALTKCCFYDEAHAQWSELISLQRAAFLEAVTGDKEAKSEARSLIRSLVQFCGLLWATRRDANLQLSHELVKEIRTTTLALADATNTNHQVMFLKCLEKYVNVLNTAGAHSPPIWDLLLEVVDLQEAIYAREPQTVTLEQRKYWLNALWIAVADVDLPRICVGERRIISALSVLEEQHPGQFRIDLITCLHAHAHHLYQMGSFGESLQATERVISIFADEGRTNDIVEMQLLEASALYFLPKSLQLAKEATGRLLLHYQRGKERLCIPVEGLVRLARAAATQQDYELALSVVEVAQDVLLQGESTLGVEVKQLRAVLAGVRSCCEGLCDDTKLSWKYDEVIQKCLSHGRPQPLDHEREAFCKLLAQLARNEASASRYRSVKRIITEVEKLVELDAGAGRHVQHGIKLDMQQLDALMDGILAFEDDAPQHVDAAGPSPGLSVIAGCLKQSKPICAHLALYSTSLMRLAERSSDETAAIIIEQAAKLDASSEGRVINADLLGVRERLMARFIKRQRSQHLRSERDGDSSFGRSS